MSVVAAEYTPEELCRALLHALRLHMQAPDESTEGALAVTVTDIASVEDRADRADLVGRVVSLLGFALNHAAHASGQSVPEMIDLLLRLIDYLAADDAM